MEAEGKFRMTRIFRVCFTIALLALAGCGQVDSATKQSDMRAIYSAYSLHPNKKGGPAKSVDDLAPLMNGADFEKDALRRLKAGNYVLIWGIEPIPVSIRLRKDQPTPILGWESSTPTSGGFVLFVTGESRPIAAKEFAAMSKVEPKADAK